ncbi:general secretion pathway protein B [Acidovorax soli]|uniref:General secretion pathway protein B n=1 Tax=Acidovorax soli TaxID=592050 RepID=A0A7X0UA01_9BURK|nr:general secretion pathway protein GspB [Acidovorax soli]MBB6560731.1 general secretion pathway protein B [Acidovorax soli]
MSYILDALRRAEAERGRGAVPGIHTQAMPAGGAPAERPAPANLVLVGTAVLAVAALAAGGTWWAMQRPAGGGAPAGTAAVAVAPPVAPAPAPPAPAVVAPLAVPPPVPAATVAPAPLPAPAPTQPVVASTVEPRPVAPKRAAEPVRERPVREAEPARREAAPPAPSPAAVAAPAAPANGPVFAQNELPPSVREQLPVLQVTGATYSSNPAHRMAIVNGQVLQEGDQAAPGLKLERIEQGRTVWSFRGYRYAVAPQ